MAGTKYEGEFYVYGRNTGSGAISFWMQPNEKAAKEMAERLCRTTGTVYLVLKKVGLFQMDAPPVRWKQTADLEGFLTDIGDEYCV